jgi:hypothetical protein
LDAERQSTLYGHHSPPRVVTIAKRPFAWSGMAQI